MKKIKIMLVSSNFYKGTKVVGRLQTLLGDKYNVFGSYRDYNAEEYAPTCDVIIGDNTCKTTDSDGVSYQIFYSAHNLANRNKVHYIPMLWTSVWTAWLVTIIIHAFTLSKNE